MYSVQSLLDRINVRLTGRHEIESNSGAFEFFLLSVLRICISIMYTRSEHFIDCGAKGPNSRVVSGPISCGQWREPCPRPDHKSKSRQSIRLHSVMYLLSYVFFVGHLRTCRRLRVPGEKKNWLIMNYQKVASAHIIPSRERALIAFHTK